LVALHNGESYFVKNGIVEELNVGKQLSGGWVILSSMHLDRDDLQLLSSLTVRGLTPKQVVEQFSKTRLERVSLTIAAIRANIPENRFVKGGPAFWCSSDLGITRRNNEDACLTASIHFSTSNITTLYRILCAADGAGEHGYGEVASKEAILEAFNKLVYAILWRETDITDLLWKAISSANKRIMEIKSEMRSDMATTLTIVLIKDSDIHIGHMGDSRAYLVNTRTGEIRQLTRDHKYVRIWWSKDSYLKKKPSFILNETS
jgi:hypothetical protein